MIMIDSWPYDLMVSGELTLDSEVTEHPVESGDSIADHIRPLPVEFTLEAIVSDTPLADIASHDSRRIDDVTIAVFGADQIPLPSDEAYARLNAIRDERRLVVIEIPIATRSGKLGKRTFKDMAMTNLSVPFSQETAGGLTFSATFRQVKVVTNKRTTVRVAVKTPTKGPKDKGLSLDKLVDGKDVLWRKGKPPGRSPATDPPGEIIGTEVVYNSGGKILHADKKTPLTTAEQEAFTKDMNRDVSLYVRRGNARVDARLLDIERQTNRGLAQADVTDAQLDDAMGRNTVDAALFGQL